MSKQSKDLIKELKSAGAKDSEIKELLPLAASLGRLKATKQSALSTTSSRRQRSKWKLFLPLGITSVAGLALGMALVILSQTVLPGSMLYPVQKFSDSISTSVDSNYRGTVMMKRAEQVKQLIADRASSSLVMATLADYRSEASAYKSVPANYAVFEYCKTNLEQAAAVAIAIKL